MADWFSYPSNFSNGTKEVTGVGTLFQYINEVTGNKFGYVFLVVIFVITSLASGSSKSGLTAAFFITAIFSVLLSALGFINPIFVIILTILLFVSIAVNLWSKY